MLRSKPNYSGCDFWRPARNTQEGGRGGGGFEESREPAGLNPRQANRHAQQLHRVMKGVIVRGLSPRRQQWAEGRPQLAMLAWDQQPASTPRQNPLRGLVFRSTTLRQDAVER